MPPVTPIRDMVDRCLIWESHADPEVHRVSKPSPDPIYPAYVVGYSDTGSGGNQAAVGSRSARGLASMVTDSRGYPGSDTGSTCGGEVVTASGGGNTESSASGHRSWDWKSCYGCFSQDNSNRGSHRGSHRGSPLDSDPSDGTEWCVSHVGSRVMLRLGAQT